MLLVVTTLSLVFAPGLLADAREPASPSAMTATVLAPTDDHLAKPTATRTRDAVEPLLVAALLVAVVAVSIAPTGSIARRHEPPHRAPLAHVASSLVRRGPPGFAA